MMDGGRGQSPGRSAQSYAVSFRHIVYLRFIFVPICVYLRSHLRFICVPICVLSAFHLCPSTNSWLEKQCYAAGVLISYRNSSIPDNNTSEHAGYGQILPFDSHPAPNIMPDGRTPWRNRWQTWDSTFGVDSNAVTLSQTTSSARTLTKTYVSPPVMSFHDSSPTAYYDASIPYNSVRTVGSGLKIDITGVSADRGSYQLHIDR